MKTILAAFALLCLTLASYAQEWPRNPKTGKVEFTGSLLWPASAKTEAQRRELVRAWYVARLTELSAQQVRDNAAANTTNGLNTYAGLPKAAVLRNGQGGAYLLSYFAELSPTPKGLSYKLSSFDFTQADATESVALEPQLLTPSESEKAALDYLRERLAKAVQSWR